MENKIKIVALYGKAGAGKDRFLQEIMKNEPGLCHEIVSCTTRPPREGEINGVNYHFLTVEEFTHKVLNGDMLEATEFREWFYGTALDALRPDIVNIGVFNTAGLQALIEDPRLEVLCVRIVADDKVRLMRQLQREQNPDCAEICRRFFADEKDFNEWEANIESEELMRACWFINNNFNERLNMVVKELADLIVEFYTGAIKGV